MPLTLSLLFHIKFRPLFIMFHCRTIFVQHEFFLTQKLLECCPKRRVPRIDNGKINRADEER